MKRNSIGRRPAPHARREGGAALLAFMLVIIAGSSYVLLTKLNNNIQQAEREQATQEALQIAKTALIGYAVTYPDKINAGDGPGYLPCPDITNNGRAGGSCSAAGGTTIGRLPFETLELPDLRDGSGERLWYVLSQNFRNNPKLIPLNSDTPATLTVDSVDDVVAVIIAPGAPVTSQTNRNGQVNNPAQYLDCENADLDLVFSRTCPGVEEFFSGQYFNDRVAYITRSELIAAVEKRVLGEVAQILNNYRSKYGAYPWPSPFADPKSGARWLKGRHSGNNGSQVLRDSSVNFTRWGITPGDRVWNLTDGSIGTVSSVSNTQLTLSGLAFGDENDFDRNDEYYVEIRALGGILQGTASSGTSGKTLVDTSKDFGDLLVGAGDVVENIETGTSGIIDSVAGSRITLSENASMTFAPGNRYRIRSNHGRATAGSAGLVLEDTKVNFLTMGIRRGDLVRNIDDGSVGFVASVNPTRLTVANLKLGTNNTFSNNHHYVISRFDGTGGISEGHLPVHEPGEAIRTGFNVDWSFLSANGNTVTQTISGSHATYNSGLINWVQTSNGHSGTLSVTADNAYCNWLSENIVDCRGKYADADFLSGTVTASTATSLRDTSKNFPEAGVKRGDKIINTSDSTQGIVSQATPRTLRISNIYGRPALNKSVGQPYRVLISTSYTDGTATPPTARFTYRLYDSSGRLANSKIGDVLENTEWNAIGIITGVDPLGRYVDFTRLQGGARQDFRPGEPYRVHHNYVDRREFVFNLTLSGAAVVRGAAGIKTRSVCRGYGTNCATGPTDTLYKGDGITRLVTVRDYDNTGALVGEARVSVPATGSPASSFRVSALNYELAEIAGELPDWFLKNRWHHFVYIAYPAMENPPGGSTSCMAGTNCLYVRMANSKTDPPRDLVFSDDTRALAVMAGKALDNQDRANTTALASYFELDNASALDNVFRRDNFDTTTSDFTHFYNDQTRSISEAP